MKKYFVFLLFLFLVSACTEERGVVYFSISDPGELEGITSLELTVSKISIHQQESDAWIDVLTEPVTLDLIELKETGVMELVATASLSEGRYNQIRLETTSVVATYNGNTEEVKLPSNVLRINIDLEVTAEEILLNFDILANESIHVAGDGKLIMTPVINVEKYKGAQVQTRGKNIEVVQARVKTQEKVGMDEKGAMGKEIIKPNEVTISETGAVERKKGTAIITVKDKNEAALAAKDKAPPVKTREGLNIEELEVSIGKVEVHADGDWITLSETPKTFNLVELQDVEAVLAQADLSTGRYTQIRFEILDANGIINGQEVPVFVPSNTIKLVGLLRVDENQISVANIDFLLDKSVHKAGEKYIFKPVIKLTTVTGVKIKARERNNNVEEIEYEGGDVVEETEIDTSEESTNEDDEETDTNEEETNQETESDDNTGESDESEEESETNGEDNEEDLVPEP
jgi:hypothetical protein